MTAWKEQLPKLTKPAIGLTFQAGEPVAIGGSKFGGCPHVPKEFLWPTDQNGRPLSFLAQFQCKELAAFDQSGLLPKTGLLSFFYDLEEQPWGYDPESRGSAKVFWFDCETLQPVQPQSIPLPELQVEYSALQEIPDWSDACPLLGLDFLDAELRPYDNARRELGFWYPDNRSQLLGWADIIQNNMTLECELIERDYYLGGSWSDIPLEERESLRKPSVEKWQLLFQLDTVATEDFELMFGDCGRIYFYIPLEDLKERRFDRTWLIQQCY